MTSLLLSVVIPAYNAARWIEACLNSIQAADPAALEVIVVDDGSTDETVAILRHHARTRTDGLSIRILEQANAGPGAARNVAIAAAQAPWLAFLDADDLWLPWTVDLLCDHLRQEPSGRLIFMQVETFGDPDIDPQPARGAARQSHYPDFWTARQAPDCPNIGTANCVMHKTLARALDGFTTATRVGEDTDLFYRVGDRAPVTFFTAPTMVRYRRGHSSLSSDASALFASLAFVLGRYEAGLYPGEGAVRVLANAVYSRVRLMFASGRGGLAYRALWRAARLLVRDGRWGLAGRTVLTPVLSLLRPKNYAFRWRSAGRG